MADVRPIVLGVDENRTAQAALAPVLSGTELTYRFITDRRKVLGGCAQLKPDVLLVFGELSSDFVIAVLDALASDSRFATLPVIVVCADLGDTAFVHGMRTSVVQLLPAPMSAHHAATIRNTFFELQQRPGSVSGAGDSRVLHRLVEHIRRTRRTGELVIEPRTPHEGKAVFVRGRLERAKFLASGSQDALKAMVALPQARYSFSEVVRRQGDGEGIVIEIEVGQDPAPEVEVISGTALPEDEPLAFELPKPPPAPPPPPPAPPPPPRESAPTPQAARIKLLLVDDDEAILRMFSTLFAKHGFAVTTATDGQQGITATAEREFDVVLADLNMPHLDGWGMLRALRDDFRTRELPVAFISAHDDYRESLRALNAGAQAYLSKGTRLEQIVGQVRKLLEPREQARALIDGKGSWSMQLSTVGPQWILRLLNRRMATGTLAAKDGWASYTLALQNGAVLRASATAGRFVAEGERAFNAFVASRAAEASWTPGAAAGVTPNVDASMDALLAAACRTLNENEQRLRDNLMVEATEIKVDQDLYAVYRQVGPKQWLECARLICEEKVPPREVIARLDVSPLDIEETMRDLIRRGVVNLAAAKT